MKTIYNKQLTAIDLKDKAYKMVHMNFNFIGLSVLEKHSDNMLFEFIRCLEVSKEEFLNEYSLWDEFWDYYADLFNPEEGEIEHMKELSFDYIHDCVDSFIENNHSNEFQSYCDNQNSENYPMWNTCFEFREEPSEEVIQAAIKAGFGVIEGLEDFGTLLFVAGCGYSFYGAHWIPFMLELPWNDDLKEEAKGINYDNQ